jgi:hypothetical protein
MPVHRGPDKVLIPLLTFSWEGGPYESHVEAAQAGVYPD